MKEIVVVGTVCKGIGEGRRLGFPTANLSYKLEKDVELESGIYAGTIEWEEGKYVGAIVIDGNWAGKDPLKFEVHIPDFDGDIYNKKATVYVKEKIREMEHFKSIEDLKSQIEKDIVKIKEISKDYV